MERLHHSLEIVDFAFNGGACFPEFGDFVFIVAHLSFFFIGSYSLFTIHKTL